MTHPIGMPVRHRRRALRWVVLLACAVPVTGGAAPPLASPDGGLRPGRWRMVVELRADTANGKRLSTPHIERQETMICLTEANRDPAALLGDEALPGGCRAYQVRAAAGQIRFTAICPADEDGLSMDMSGAGSYAGDRMSLRLDARVEAEGNQASMSGTIVATRAGACPAGK